MFKIGDRVTYIGKLSEHVGRSGNIKVIKNGDIGMKTDNYYAPKKNMIWGKESEFKPVSNEMPKGSLEEAYREEANTTYPYMRGIK